MRLFPIAAACVLSGTALAAPKFDSAYTDLIFEGAQATCKLLELDEESASSIFECKGHSGIKIYVGEGDLRSFVSFGWNARGEIAAEQTFPQFNSLGAKLEWRLKDGKPFATILRWRLDGDGDTVPRSEVLVVTQLDEGNQCWVATVSASKNKNANELARKAADDLAGTVHCTPETEPEIIGVPNDE